MPLRDRLFALLIIVPAVILADQGMKAWAVAVLPPGPVMHRLGDAYVGLGVYRHETAVVEGLLAGNLASYLIVLVLCGMAALLHLWGGQDRSEILWRWAYPMAIGGALANLTDRLLRGHVVDFLGPFAFGRWAVPYAVNLADVILIAGVGLAIVNWFYARLSSLRRGSGPAASGPAARGTGPPPAG